MQQRKSTLGRPSGTDGSDFSYRMVVDPRYTKVAQGKSRLYALILTQAFIQVIGVLCTFLNASKQEDPNRLAVTSIIIGFISLAVGESGRRHSRVTFLRLYMFASSTATLLSVACVVKSNMSLEVVLDQSKWAAKKLELVEVGCALISVLVQIFTIWTTVSLISNMSPPKRAS